MCLMALHPSRVSQDTQFKPVGPDRLPKAYLFGQTAIRGPIFPNVTFAFYTSTMSRYRPPRVQGSPYITQEGAALLGAELHA